VPAEFAPWRDRLAALRPRWYRLVFNWERYQPAASPAPDWSAAQDGCGRGVPPCFAHAGLRDVLRAVRDRQRADGGWEVIVSPYGVPRWARRPRAGCPGGGGVGLGAYRRMVRSLAELGRQEGVPLRWWSPWNEPNHPTFLRPQRVRCDPGSRSLAATQYAELVRVVREEAGPGVRLVLGEVAGYATPRPDRGGAAEFARALPRDVACADAVWGQHTYVGRGTDALAADRARSGNRPLLRAVRGALASHGCAREHRIWITETGSRGECEGMTDALAAWREDPRVDVAIQYTFREDLLFPVGLADAGLTRTLPAYAAWAGGTCGT